MNPLTRRQFPAVLGAGVLFTGATMADDKKPDAPKGPSEAPFERDYTAPTFQPSWKKQQINRVLVQDFVIFAHSDLEMTKKLLAKEPALLNAAVDWGGGDWETALGAAAHMGNRDIALFLLAGGARMDLFASAMLGQLEIVKAMLTLQPKLIDAKGPHGFSLHWHANAGGTEAEKVLEYLQSVKKVELPKFPMKK
ncbi:ankyrin repeat domain-containing protein [Limnoglobus roseus]|uniref:Ankyrin repeat domain-containing protein n=1 Tax=Limnoglobus roseus TaxID=2598579 RepID=A0A5C1AB36_9BACT|nr:ankyrin repeat domain-containing protein [Limnoglobus roseus]QEL14344.1 ankyrin repeat domain-containing protein [Limnoglobus roseus]